MSTIRHWILAIAAVLGFAGVLFAAAGSHWVEGLDEPARYRLWQAANLVNLVHAVALLSMAALAIPFSQRLIGASAVMMAGGVALFSGSIYAALIGDLENPGPAAPAGGLLLLLSWLLLFAAAFTKGKPD